MAELTRCKHAETGAEAELPTDALGAWRAHGWEPISESRTFEEAEAQRVAAENAAAAHVEEVVEILTGGEDLNIKEVLKQVGDDPAAAAAALAVEQSQESPRSTLVARLNQIINPAGDAGTKKES